MMRFEVWTSLILVSVLMLASGCGPKEEIAKYTVPRQPKVVKKAQSKQALNSNGQATQGHGHELRWKVPEGWIAKAVPDVADRNELLGILTQDRLAGLNFTLEMQNTPPFNSAVDVGEHRSYILNQINDETAKLSPVEQHAFWDVPQNHHLLQNLYIAYRRAGIHQKCLAICEVRVKRRPWSAEAHFDLAFSQFRIGNQEKALEAAKLAFELSPTMPHLKELIWSLQEDRVKHTDFY